jgi:hypothetical protein
MFRSYCSGPLPFSSYVMCSKLINASVPGTIDEKKMIKYFNDEKSVIYHRIVNQNLCIDGARQIGAIIVNLGAEDLLEGKVNFNEYLTYCNLCYMHRFVIFLCKCKSHVFCIYPHKNNPKRIKLFFCE